MKAQPSRAARSRQRAVEAPRTPAPEPEETPDEGSALVGWTPADPVDRLARSQVNALQRSAGNRAVAGLMRAQALSVQRAPAPAPPRGATKPGGTTKPRGSGPSFDSYADLVNGFQDLAAALINRGGAGLDSVRFGKDLSSAHRSLLWSVRTVFIGAQDADPDNRRKAAGSWPRVSARMLDAVAEAKRLNLPGAPLAAVADQIAMVNKRLGAAKGRQDVPQAESYEDLNETIFAIHLLLWENAQMGESGPGIVREETAGRADIAVSSGIKEINEKVRGRLSAVKVGSHATSRHVQLVESLRAALILARTEKAGSAYAALVKFRSLEGEIRYALQRGANFNIIGLDIGEVAGRVEQTKSILNAHYAAVHGGNLEAVLTKQRAPGEVKLRQKIAENFGPSGKAGLAEQLGIEDVQNALSVIQSHLVKSDKPGIWTITNGPTTIQIWEAQALGLHEKAREALKGYMQSIYSALVRARDDYDSIKLGNSRTKLRILGFLGGADDPGSFDLEVNRLRILRDKGVKTLIDAGDYVGAFKLIIQEKPGVEQRVKAEAEYDADLDRGYRRLATTMSIVQVALVSLVPIAGEAALATAPAWAVGVTAVGAGAGGAFVGEGSRQLATGDHDAGKLMSRTWQGGVIGAGAIAPAATRQVGGVLAAGGEGFAAKGGQVLAEGFVNEAQNLASGGKPGEGMVGGTLGGIAGHGTQLLPKVMQGGVAGKLVQVGVGAGVGEVTTGDALSGAAGALVPALVTKSPTATGGHDTATPTKAPGGPKEPAIPIGGAEAITGGGGGGGSSGGGGTGGGGGGGGRTGGGAPAGPTPGAETTPGTFPPRAPAAPAGPTPGAETTPGTFPPRAPAAPAGPTPGAETTPGTFPPRAPAAPAGPTPGAETTPGTFPPRAPAAPAGPTPGAETTPGTGIHERPPATPPGPAGGETAPDGLAGRAPIPEPGGGTAPDGRANKGPVGAETGADVAGTGGAIKKGPPPVGAQTGADVAGTGGAIKKGPSPGGVAPGQPGPGGPPPGGNQPAIRPPTPDQGGLLPKSKVPHDLTPSPEPVYKYDDLVKMNIEGRAGQHSGRDLPASGENAAPSTPTAKYAPEEKGRYVRTGDQLTAGTTAEKSWVVKDSNDPTKKYLFKPTEAEHLVDRDGNTVRIERAVERGIVEGQQAPREVAGGMVAKELGYEAAPQGQLVTIEGKQGVLIEWRESNSLADLARKDHAAFKRLIESQEFRDAMVNMDALDYLINNVDRGANFGNYLYEFQNGQLKLTPIDHALSFTSTKDRASIEGFTRDLPEKYPPDLVTKLEGISKNRAEFIEKIRPFVGDAAIEGFVHRLDIMIGDMHKKQQAAP